ncbi:MAG: DNA topoisomerase (ATP-hydrolyzing) subunit B [Bacteroidetes bacterium QS_9_68_14]|nr:MAG: DNA topoisomerase (ATP-hydrolyzing) subunit B [Bacteroidetes bacterium QS_9_68_14]
MEPTTTDPADDAPPENGAPGSEAPDAGDIDPADRDLSAYAASNIQILEGLEAVRKRPAMYIGDVGMRGLHHLVYEVVDNAIDEAMAGHCSEIEVSVCEDGCVRVTDDGRGIPVEEHPSEGRSALEVVMTVLHAGGKFDKGSYKVSGGLHGVGVSCVNALSGHFETEVRRNGSLWRQGYEKGAPLGPVEEVRPLAEGEGTGTEITFYPDPDIFKETDFRFDTLADRLRELAYLNPGVQIAIEDQREEDEDLRREEYEFEGGLAAFIDYLDEARDPIHETITIDSGGEGVEVPVELAMRYNDGFNQNVLTFVNNINTHEGGTHVTGFRRALTRTLKTYAQKNGLLDKVKCDLRGDDFREGLTAVLSVKVAEPQFEGQTKTKLGNSEVQGAVESLVGTELGKWLEDHPDTAEKIIEKVVMAAQARSAARKARELVQRKSVFSSGSLPGKLADCASRDPSESEIYLVEGDSAGGSAKQARDREFQAILPLRGKILNVEKARLDRILENNEIRNMVTALGCGLTSTEDEFSLEDLRYERAVIMTDADVDGAHIRTLLLTFFYRQLRPLIEQGYIYIALPPLFRVHKGQAEEYAWTEEDKQRIAREMEQNVRGTPSVQRYKGLGEMNPEQLWQTTMDPETRMTQQITIEDAAAADRIFSTLMGGSVEPRREFIERNAKYATIDL